MSFDDEREREESEIDKCSLISFKNQFIVVAFEESGRMVATHTNDNT